MKDKYLILAINTGSTSTKVSAYENENAVFSASIKHSTEELNRFQSVWDQYDYRKNSVIGAVVNNGLKLNDFDIIACRGGNIKPVKGGIYEVTTKMLEDMKSGKYGIHPTNVGNLVAYDIGQENKIPVVTIDPPVTDELCDYARFSGIPQISRQSSFHALNQKATARKVAAKLQRAYEELNMIVVHMGGGISVGAHEKGLVIDVNNALDGDGPFSPERAGTLPNAALIKMCFSGEYDKTQMLKLMTGKGGLVAYLGTTDALEIEARIQNGDKYAEDVYMAMAYQVVKEIGSMAAVLGGKVDAIAFTGSLAYSKRLMDFIKPRVSFIAPIYEVPGENEMEALAAGALRYITGKEQPRIYE
ncbi:MAG: Butyrate kinase [Firmicutes bacterium]|nr:Butyrate kinase [Bacillota bacterium]MDI6706250.1 butyrate kinase [Bacillota bacterium]